MVYRYPDCYFQCCYPSCNKFEKLKRQRQWPTEGQGSQIQGQQPQAQWPTESQGPATSHLPTEWPSEYDSPFFNPKIKYCKEQCTAMSYNEKVRIADSCQGYEVFMCFYSGYEEYAGFWKINGILKQNNTHYVSVQDALGIGRLFDIRSIKCLSYCR